MSRLRVDQITNFAENGPPLAVEGLTIASGKKFRIVGERTILNSNDPGEEGEICWDQLYLFVCVSTNNWRRVAFDTW